MSLFIGAHILYLKASLCAARKIINRPLLRSILRKHCGTALLSLFTVLSFFSCDSIRHAGGKFISSIYF